MLEHRTFVGGFVGQELLGEELLEDRCDDGIDEGMIIGMGRVGGTGSGDHLFKEDGTAGVGDPERKRARCSKLS
jgi:hypothetical protein